MSAGGEGARAAAGLALAGVLAVALPLPRPAVAGEAAGPAAPAVQTVRCAGTGAPSLRDAASNLSVVRTSTRRAAKAQALRRCRAAMEALPLAGGPTVGDAVARDQALADAVRDALRRARVVGAPRYFADGGVALQLEVPVDGALARRLAAAGGR